jgi:hypothetical protein
MSEPCKKAADGGKIVELCSAANVIEAYAIRNLLEASGIRSRVVGDFLNNAFGAVPFGEVTSPRVWVREEDLERAQQIVNDSSLPPDP